MFALRGHIPQRFTNLRKMDWDYLASVYNVTPAYGAADSMQSAEDDLDAAVASSSSVHETASSEETIAALQKRDLILELPGWCSKKTLPVREI